MGKKSRTKGARVEREVVNILRQAGLDAVRSAPMQTFKPNDEPDIRCEGKRIEVKARADGFKQIYTWIEGNDWLVIKANGKPYLVIKTLEDEING